MLIYPDPPPSGLDINYEYITINWAVGGTPTDTPQDKVILGSDTPLFDKTLITRYLKLKYLESAGFDTTKAQDDFSQSFSFLTGADKGAEIISAGRNHRAYPYLSVLNLPDHGFSL